VKENMFFFIFMGPCIVRYRGGIYDQQDATNSQNLFLEMLYMFRAIIAYHKELGTVCAAVRCISVRFSLLCFPNNFANLMTEITPLFGKSFSYSGVIYEMEVFDIPLNDRQSEKNIPGFYSCSWRRMRLHTRYGTHGKVTEVKQHLRV
jgi:hypothetical protein